MHHLETQPFTTSSYHGTKLVSFHFSRAAHKEPF